MLAPLPGSGGYGGGRGGRHGVMRRERAARLKNKIDEQVRC